MMCTGNRLMMMAGASYKSNNCQSNPLEDAYFICEENNTLGLAGGSGTNNSGEYPLHLMANSVFSICQNYREGQNVDPIFLLNQAFKNSRTTPGESSALILALKNFIDGSYLHAANLGENGFLLIRGGKIVYESLAKKSKLVKSCVSAIEHMVPVKCGDIVVAGTDGLFDNVYGYEIEMLEQMFMEGMLDSPEVLADIIVHYALRKSQVDITVVVAYIGPEE